MKKKTKLAEIREVLQQAENLVGIRSDVFWTWICDHFSLGSLAMLQVHLKQIPQDALESELELIRSEYAWCAKEAESQLRRMSRQCRH